MRGSTPGVDLVWASPAFHAGKDGRDAKDTGGPFLLITREDGMELAPRAQSLTDVSVAMIIN